MSTVFCASSAQPEWAGMNSAILPEPSLQEHISVIPVVNDSATLLAALDRGEMLPTRWYTDPVITEREIALIFRKSWNYIGPIGELAEPGDYIAGQIGEV